MKRWLAQYSIVQAVLLIILLLFVQSTVVSASATTVPFYRFYWGWEGKQEHFYSQSLQVPAGWQYEGIEGYVSPVQLPYMVPLYRFFQEATWDHFYTASAQEAADIPAYYDHEGIAGYVLPPNMDIPGTVALYRFDHTYSIGNNITGSRWYQDHFYSLGSGTPAGFVAEGVACRVWKGPVNLPDTLFVLLSPSASTKILQGGVLPVKWKIWNGGGYLRLSYTEDSGASWNIIGSIPLQENYANIINGSYDWKMPPSLKGKLQLKAEWVRDNSGDSPPWISVMSTIFTVEPRFERIRVAP
jgi:hypothetical protein